MSSLVFAEKFSSKIHLDIQKYNLKNGMKVVLNPDHKLNTAFYLLGFSVGSRHERPGITGLSHMFEHLMFRGTEKYPDFNKTYDENGVIGVNAFTSHDYTAYLGSFLPEKLKLVLDVEADRMTHLILNQDKLDKERGAVQEERLQYLNRPSGLLFKNVFDLVFTKHPYRWPIIGYGKDIANYTLEDLQNWYQTYYSPNNATLVISGNFSVKKAKSLIEKYFGALPAKEIPVEKTIQEPEHLQARSRIVHKKVQAPLSALVYKGPPAGDKELYALEVISYILGAGESSLLYKKLVREKKLLSSISSYVHSLTQQGVFLINYAFVDISQEQKIKELILEEIKKAFSQITERSLEKVKNIQMNIMVDSLKTSSRRANLILSSEMRFNDYKKMYEKLDFIQEMTPEFIQSVGEKYLDPSKLSYVTVR